MFFPFFADLLNRVTASENKNTGRITKLAMKNVQTDIIILFYYDYVKCVHSFRGQNELQWKGGGGAQEIERK